MARRRQHSLQEIKVMSLQIAENIVLEEGYKAVTARRLAMEMGYTVGSLYTVFDSMADLLLHLKARILERLYQELRGINKTNQSAEENIVLLAKNCLIFVRRNLHYGQLFFKYSTANPFWYLRKQQPIFHLFEQALEQIVANPNIRQSKLVSRILCANLQGICGLILNSTYPVTDKKIEQMVEIQISCFLNGCLQKPIKPCYELQPKKE